MTPFHPKVIVCDHITSLGICIWSGKHIDVAIVFGATWALVGIVLEVDATYVAPKFPLSPFI